MKTSMRRPQAGFTLVELLVVITIIAILAAAGFGAGAAAIQRAKRATALGTCVSIETAVNNFYNEYSSLPTDETVDTTLKTDTNIDFLSVLLGLETTEPPKNTRMIKFLTVGEGKAKRNGLIYSEDGKSVTGLYDPWGGPFNVILDADNDENVLPVPAAGTAPTLHGKRVAVWSNGADGVKGGGKPTDDVKTW